MSSAVPVSATDEGKEELSSSSSSSKEEDRSYIAPGYRHLRVPDIARIVPTTTILGEQITEAEADEACSQNYNLEHMLAKGKYGLVYRACLAHGAAAPKKVESKGLASSSSSSSSATSSASSAPVKCEYAIKISRINSSMAYLTAIVDATVISSLQDVKWSDTTSTKQDLVPRFFRSWICRSKFYMVMDLWDGDMQSKGQNQFTDYRIDYPDIPFNIVGTRRILMYTIDQFQNMFLIARKLDELGIIHGDLAARQILYRGKEADVMSVTDFGFAETYGWTQNADYGDCPKFDGGLGTSNVLSQLKPYFNQWQLSQYFLMNVTLIVETLDETYADNIRQFTGLTDTPEDWQTLLLQTCRSAIINQKIGAYDTDQKFLIGQPMSAVRGYVYESPSSAKEKTEPITRSNLSKSINLERVNAEIPNYLRQQIRIVAR